MKKCKLFSILAIVLSCSMVLPSCKLHKIQPTTEEEEEEEWTEPTPSETAAEMLVLTMDQFVSDGRMFAEEDATTAATTSTQPEPKETFFAPEATIVNTFTIGDMTYSMSNDWNYIDDSESGIRNFFIDLGTRRTNMVVYKSNDDSSWDVLDAQTFEENAKGFGDLFVDNLENGKVVSNEIHTDGSIYYADILFDGIYTAYQNTDMYLYFRLYAVPNTTTLYVVGMLIDKNDEDIMDSIMTTYRDTLASVEFAGVDLYTEHTMGRMTYSVPTDWFDASEEGVAGYVPDITKSDIVLMVITSESSYVDGMSEEQFSLMIDSLNEAFLGGMTNGTILQNDVHGDTMPQYADVVYDGIYNGYDSVLYARYYADSYGVGYFFILQMDKTADEIGKEEALAQYKRTISKVVFEIS